MDREEIEENIHEGLWVQIRTWQNPMNILYSSLHSKGQPEFIRNISDDWISYGNEAEKDKFYRRRMASSLEQQKLALQVMDWLNLASRRYNTHNAKVMRAIISLRCLRLYDNSYGYRELSKQLAKMGVSLSKDTIRRRYMVALDDLYHSINLHNK